MFFILSTVTKECETKKENRENTNDINGTITSLKILEFTGSENKNYYSYACEKKKNTGYRDLICCISS